MPNENLGGDPPQNSPQISPLEEQEPMRDRGQQHSEQQNYQIKKLSDDVHWTTHAMFWVQIGLGIIGILALWIYHGQLVEMQQSLRISQKQLSESKNQLDTSMSHFNRTARQMLAQTDTEQQATEVSREALVDVQRAFVFASPVITREAEPPGFFISVQFGNSGYTPTRDLRMHVSFRDMNSIPKNFGFPDQWGLGQPHINTPTYIAPRGYASIFLPMFLSDKAAKAEISNHNLPTTYLWGWAKYRDIFQRTKWHKTLFCYKFVAFPTPPDAKGVSSGISLAANNCPEHNCADEECEQKN